MKKQRQLFWLLMAAYTLSAAYQFYRFRLNQYPAFDRSGTTEMVGYSILFVWAALALVEQQWAIRAIVLLCSLQLTFTFFYFIPVIFVQRHPAFWDWAECITFIALIARAGYLAVSIQRTYELHRQHQLT